MFQSKAETEALMAQAVALNAAHLYDSSTNYDFVEGQKTLNRLGRRVTIAGFLVCLAIFAFACFASGLVLQLKHINIYRIFVTIGWLTYIPIVLLWIFKDRLSRHAPWIPITK